MVNWNELNYTFVEAWHHTQQKPELMTECGSIDSNLNISTIATEVIQTVGRFAESYASDMLYDMRRLMDFAEKPRDFINTNPRQAFLFGIRKSGVDSFGFCFSRLKDSVTIWDPSHALYCFTERIYRKILMVEARIRFNNGKPDGVVAALRDITNAVYKIDERDYYLCKYQECDGDHDKIVNDYAALAGQCIDIRRSSASIGKMLDPIIAELARDNSAATFAKNILDNLPEGSKWHED